MGEREDLADPTGPACLHREAPKVPKPLEERPTSFEISRALRRSFCREFVTNEAEPFGRAVSLPAPAWLLRAIGAGLTCPSAPSRAMQSVRCQRLSRLCELMYSILPGLRSIF